MAVHSSIIGEYQSCFPGLVDIHIALQMVNIASSLTYKGPIGLYVHTDLLLENVPLFLPLPQLPVDPPQVILQPLELVSQ